MADRIVEVVAGSVDDFQEGQLYTVDVKDHKILLVKEDGQFYATGNKCPHNGGPLSEGAYCKGVVRCPWHGASFCVKTGDIEDFPGLDGIHTFQTTVKDGNVVVKADLHKLENHKRQRPMVKRCERNKKTVVLVGGGPASLTCAETLRQEGYTGRIILVCKEDCLPYERTLLSKHFVSKEDDFTLRDQEFYDKNGIEVILGKEVTKVVHLEKKVELADGSHLKYDMLFVATGLKPRTIQVPGSDLTNIFLPHYSKDTWNIYENSDGKNVVIIGSAFVGMEIASCLVEKAASINVVEVRKVPFDLCLGKEIGNIIQKVHERRGVRFHFETSVKEFRGENGRLKEVILLNGTVLPADLCVMGAGGVPVTGFLTDSGLNMTSAGFVVVDKNMKTNLPDVYAAGDIVVFPFNLDSDKLVNIQHWALAHKLGKIAALHMVGKPEDVKTVSYFWTEQYGKTIRFTGRTHGYDDIIIYGDIDTDRFLAYYLQKGRVIGAISLEWDPLVSQAAELFSRGVNLYNDDVRTSPDKWVTKKLREISAKA